MPIRVLVVDDSMFMRRLASDILNADPDIEVVDTARDGAEAILKVCRLRPDCVTLDLVMPGQDGLMALRRIMAECPTPVVVLSAHTRNGADLTMECLAAGAVGFVPKPSGELSLDLEKVRVWLTHEVKAAARSNVAGITLPSVSHVRKGRHPKGASGKIVVMGASTGGLQTLRAILPALPADFPAPIIVVQHVPTALFSQSLTEYLNAVSEPPVTLAANYQVIYPGTVYLAPGGYHLTVEPWSNQRSPCGTAKARTAVLHLEGAAPGALSPSVDITMQSVSGLYAENAVGVILTGMGCDGVAGMRAIKQAGGKTLVQDESSLVFGMPKAVIDAGYADRVLPLREMAQAIADTVASDEACGAPRRVGAAFV